MADPQLDTDSMLTFMDEMAKRADKLKAAVSGMGETSSKNMRQAGETAVKFNDVLSSMSRNLMGPAGVVAGFYAVGKSLESFASGQLRLQNLSKDAGYTVEAVKKLQQAGQFMGYTFEEATKFAQGFGNTINTLRVFHQDAEIWKSLAALREGGYAFAQELTKMAEAGTSYETILLRVAREYRAQIARGTEDGRRTAQALADAFKLPPSYLAEIEESLSKVKTPHIFTPADQARQKQYNQEWIKILQNVYDEWEGIQNRAIEKIVQGFQGWGNILRGLQKRNLSQEIEEFRRSGKGLDVDDPDALPGKAGTANEPSPYQRLRKWWRGSSLMGSEGGTTEFSAKQHESLDIEKDSNKSLRGIFDILDRAFGVGASTGAGGSGGGGGAPGGGGSGPIFRSGIGGMGGTRGNRNNNRGNMKYGEFAKSMGATGADERGFAIFPDQATGDAAHAALIKQPQYQNLTLEQFGNKYAEGSAAWKQTVGSALGIGSSDIVNTADPRLLEGIRRAEGTSTSGRMDPMAGTGARPIGREGTTIIRSLSGRQFTVAKEFAPNFQGFINDYEKAGGVIGPDSGGLGSRGNPSYHPLGRAIDLNQIGYGVRSRNGVTLPEDVENALAEKWGLYPGSKFRNRSDRGHFEVRDAELARARLDRSMRAGSGGGDLGTASISVDFKNMPKGVKGEADMDSGVFKTLRINRGQAPLAGSTTGSQNNWQIAE